VGSASRGHTRRRVLGGATLGAALWTAGGCGLFDGEPDPPPPPDALQPVLDEALTLAAAYERAAVTRPEFTSLAADHRAHATELTRVIGAAVVPQPSASAAAAGPATPAEFRAAEQAALKTVSALAKTAPADRAMLVGSIAACRATHAEALR
jgi:hypothetical protein